jgi:hypothetical protein
LVGVAEAVESSEPACCPRASLRRSRRRPPLGANPQSRKLMYELAKCEELATSSDDAAAAPDPPPRMGGDGGCRRRARSLAGDGDVDGEPPAAAAATATPLCGDELLVSNGSRRTPTCSACVTALPPRLTRAARLGACPSDTAAAHGMARAEHMEHMRGRGGSTVVDEQ